MGKKRFIEKLKDDDYGEQIREYSIKGIGKCYGEYFKNKAKLKTPTIETLAESVKELQQRIYVAEKKIAEMENHLFPEPADFCLDAVKDSIKGYIEDRKEIPAPVIQEYNRLVLPDYIEFFEYREKPYVCASTKAYIHDLYASIGIIREHISKNEVISFELLSEYNLNRREINEWNKGRKDSI
jgi:hypothetical protein